MRQLFSASGRLYGTPVPKIANRRGTILAGHQKTMQIEARAH